MNRVFALLILTFIYFIFYFIRLYSRKLPYAEQKLFSSINNTTHSEIAFFNYQMIYRLTFEGQSFLNE